MTRVDSTVPLMHHDPDRSWITDPNSDHPKGKHSPVPLMHHDPDRSWITDPNSDHPKGTHPVSHRNIQTPKRELKIRRAAEYFWRNSLCLVSRWNTASCVWYIFSIETKPKELKVKSSKGMLIKTGYQTSFTVVISLFELGVLLMSYRNEDDVSQMYLCNKKNCNGKMMISLKSCSLILLDHISVQFFYWLWIIKFIFKTSLSVKQASCLQYSQKYVYYFSQPWRSFMRYSVV